MVKDATHHPDYKVQKRCLVLDPNTNKKHMYKHKNKYTNIYDIVLFIPDPLGILSRGKRVKGIVKEEEKGCEP